MYKTISTVDSLMAFNYRVLTNGNIPEITQGIKDEDLRQILTFNKIFHNNMNEMYQKYHMIDKTRDYADLLDHYVDNIRGVVVILEAIHKYLNITTVDTFERRLATKNAVGNALITTLCTPQEAKNYRFDNNTIYYITYCGPSLIQISYIDPLRSIYDRPLTHMKFKFRELYPVVPAVRSYVESLTGNATIAARVTTNLDTDIVTKVEYDGVQGAMHQLMNIFPRSLIISNPYLYIDDLIQYTSMYCKDVDEARSYQTMDINKLFWKDKLIVFPNDSFDEYLQFLSEAANNKYTRAIYLTLYRIGNDPDIYYILKDAVSKGISVYVNIELCATGEDVNKFWMKEMSTIGIHVSTYAIGKLKVHSKLTLVTFENGQSIAQVGTGNFHTKTTKQYTDLCLLTSDPNICKQIESLFHLFMGEKHIDFDGDLLVTRYNARENLINLIRTEAFRGVNGYIAIKCNSLDDKQIIVELEKAANTGVKIDLIIRGICTWIPQTPNVMVKSIIWDKLEHSRVYCFGKVNPIMYIGSLDLMTNKINNRIETLVKIKDPDIVIAVGKYLNTYITNTNESWIQRTDGSYTKEV